jgi:GNAT superfamily N-acetyltransferase
MISAEKAIKTLRRDLTISSVLKGVLFAALVLVPTFGPTFGLGISAGTLLLILGAGWIILSYFSAKNSLMAADSPQLIASGHFDEAEQEIERVIRSFWLLRSVKLLGLHHLAVLRHAQRQWRESALLSRALLRQRLTALPGIARTTRLMLADSLLELGDLAGAHEALLSLYAHKLTLQEAMNLLVVQLDYESRIGAWPAMFQNIGSKIQLAELMPGPSAARTQAMLALAATNLNRPDWANWLIRRAELLTDINELTTQRPILKQLWK